MQDITPAGTYLLRWVESTTEEATDVVWELHKLHETTTTSMVWTLCFCGGSSM